jgi:hypothetical protein
VIYDTPTPMPMLGLTTREFHECLSEHLVSVLIVTH